MPRHLAFFILAVAFLSGIIYASLGVSVYGSLIPAALLCVALLGLRTGDWIAGIATVLVLVGGIYYIHDDVRYQAAVSRVPTSAKIEGLITSDPKHELAFESFYAQADIGRLLVQTSPDAPYAYGDRLLLAGSIEKPQPDSYGRFLEKEHVVGTMKNPEITLLGSGQGNPLLASLLAAKQSIRRSFERLLPPEKAAFLFGILMGTNENFSKDFSNELSASGMKFLTAIDGLHMTIIILIISSLLCSFLPRRYALIATLICAILFVALTGFTASGVRAAAMACIAGLAEQVSRIYAPRNALVLVALVLALINPKILVLDIGFQLSFVAVLSIIYLKPVLERLLRLDAASRFFGLKDSLLITISVQLATAPILITQFQNFSLTALMASLSIVVVLPYLIGSGFLLAVTAWIFFPAAQLLSFFASAFLSYVMWVISIAAHYALPFNPTLSWIAIIAYYAALVGLLLWLDQ